MLRIQIADSAYRAPREADNIQKQDWSPYSGAPSGVCGRFLAGRISKDDAYIVITMRRYPRFVRRELRDEYLTDMAPDRELFEDWLTIKRASGSHEGGLPEFELRGEVRVE